MNARAAEYRLLIEDVIAGGLLEEDEIAALREILTSARARNGTREPIPAEETTMTNGKPGDDDSKFGGDSVPGTMDPGPQPKPEPAQQPAPDDESKKGSG